MWINQHHKVICNNVLNEITPCDSVLFQQNLPLQISLVYHEVYQLSRFRGAGPEFLAYATLLGFWKFYKIYVTYEQNMEFL